MVVTDVASSGDADVGITRVDVAAADFSVSDVADVGVADVENRDFRTALIVFLYGKKEDEPRIKCLSDARMMFIS